MNLKEQVIEAARVLLATSTAGMTAEALAGQVAKQVGRQLPMAQVTAVLRERPQLFVEGEGGRWRLRVQAVEALPDETLFAQTTPFSPARRVLQRGCYVIFDLEATRQDAYSSATEIIQIAAQRFVDGVAQAPWASFERPLVPNPEHIIRLTKITNDDVRGAPPVAEVLRDFFAYVGDLPRIPHNGASFVGPLLQETC